MSLPRPRTEPGRAGLAALLAAPRRALVGFDFDGTLAPIVPRPEDARPADGVVAALTRLAAAVGQVAVVTGRPAGWVAEVAGLAVVPGLVILGQYGAERWAGGRLEVPAPPPGVAVLRARLPELLAGADPGVWLEDKELSLVVHTRPAADPEGALAALSAPVHALAEQHGMVVHDGRQVLEIRIAGVDKGRALRRLVGELAPGAVTFMGDDLGDLPAFRVVDELRAGGLPGLTVCSVSPEAPEVAAAADLVVDGPTGVAGLVAGIASRLAA